MAKATRMYVSDVMKLCRSIRKMESGTIWFSPSWNKRDLRKRDKMKLRDTEKYKRRQKERVRSKERRAIRRREETWEE